MMKPLTPAQQRIMNVSSEIGINYAGSRCSYSIGERDMTGPEKQVLKRLLNNWILRKINVTSIKQRQENIEAAHCDGLCYYEYKVGTLDSLIASGDMIDATEVVEAGIPIVISQTVWEIFEEFHDRIDRIHQIQARLDECIAANCKRDEEGYDLNGPARYYYTMDDCGVEIIIDCTPGVYKEEMWEIGIFIMHANDNE